MNIRLRPGGLARFAALAGAAVLVLGLMAGCGGDTGDADRPPPPPAGGGPQAAIARGEVTTVTPVETIGPDVEQAIWDHLAARGGVDKHDVSELSFAAGGEDCTVLDVLVDEGAVLAHEGSDRPMATNPSGTAGAVISTAVAEKDRCIAVVSDALSDLDSP